MDEERTSPSIAKRIKDARLKNGYSVDQVAKGCGVTRSAVQMYECGQRVPRDSIKVAMANFFGETVQDLFF